MSHLHCFTQRMLLGKDPYICVQKGMCYCPSLPHNNKCVFPYPSSRSSEETAKLLLDAGANPNSKSHNGATPLTVAARGGNPGVLAALASHPDTKLNSQVCNQLV